MTLPESSALTALVHVAQLGSLTRAAERMGRTHSAVSRKLKGLEQSLGFALTQPEGRGVVLTPRARAYVEEIAPLLEQIDRAGRAGSALGGALTLSVAQGFASSWLVHHLGAFRDLHPGIDLRLLSPAGYGDLTPNVDLHITFALPEEVPHQAQRLMEVGFFPVLSPAQLSAIDPADPETLLRIPLLHLNRRSDWRAWLAQAAGVFGDLPTGIVFADMHIMLEAARAGQGAALGDTLTAQHLLETGQLSAPFPMRLPAQRAYFLVEGASAPNLMAEAFSDWLKGQFAADQALPKSAMGVAGSR